MELTIHQAIRLAVAHHSAGRLAEAEEVYRRVLSAEPGNADAMEMLGVVASQRGRHAEALGLIDRALTLKPQAADYHANRGIVLMALGRTQEAIAAFWRALELQRDFPSAVDQLAKAQMGMNRPEEAVEVYRKYLAIRPDDAAATLNLGIALRESGRLDEAIDAYRRCLAIEPAYAEAHLNLGASLSAAGRVDDAIAEYRRAIELRPDLPEAHHNLSLLLLMKGEFTDGWKEFEWRWQCRDFPSRRRDFSQPMWRGEPLQGKTILVHAEQGMGDTIQFTRYFPAVRDRGAKIVLECQGPLVGLISGVKDIEQVVKAGDPLPAFDVHCPMMSLPLAMGTRLEMIPGSVPYLAADEALKKKWAQKLGPRDGSLRVGLNWSGNAGFARDRTRSLSLGQLAPLAMPGVTFFSLQKGAAAEQIANAPSAMRIFDIGSQIDDFADSAAVISQIDLVISTDTSIPHLAGALGAEIWLMLQFAADWRWMTGRDNSPWYPTMRLFRQTSRGDWAGVIEKVSREFAGRINPK
jgi:tetratricopeptide (TPR) repeat protein